MAKNKHFMMVLWGDFSRRLEIPQNCLKHLEEALGKQDKGSIPAKLVDSSGRIWRVLIERTTNGTHFTSGWPKFVGDHKLKENEFLVFRYDGIQQFTVTIFGESLCERETMIREEVAEQTPEVMSLSDSEESEGSDMILEEIAKRAPEVISLSDSEGSEESESDDEEEDENEDSLARNKFKKKGASSLSPPYPSSSRKKMKGQYVSRRHAVTHLEKQKATNFEGSEESESDEEEEEDENEDYETNDSLARNKFKKRGASSQCPPHPSSSRKKMKGQLPQRSGLSKENEDYETDDSLAGNKFKKRGASSLSPSHLSSSRKKMRGQYVSRRRAVTNLEKQKAVEAAFSFTSKNPHFMIRMTANFVSRWSLMRFPMGFSYNHLPHKKSKVVLKNSAGKEWIGSYNTESNSYRGVISLGWTHFARDNHLEEDDYCVFELVSSTHPELLVHIFRVVVEVVPAVWIQNK